MTKNIKPIVNFLFEAGMLAKTPRSGFYFLGSGEQSVAEHTNRMIYIGYVLSMLEKDIDTEKLLKLCLLHDLAEARTSDLNYVHQKYTKSNEKKAIKDLTDTLPFGGDILNLVDEYNKKETKEATLAHDADQLEMLLSLKEQIDIGNERAEDWAGFALKRLKTDSAKKIAAGIMKTGSDEWWFGDREDEWWVSRNREAQKHENIEA